MAEYWIIPVGDVERAFRAEFKIDGDARFVVCFKDLAEPFVVVGRSVLGPIMEQNTLKVLILVREDLSLKLIRPVPARYKLLTTVTVVTVPIISVGNISGLRLIDK